MNFLLKFLQEHSIENSLCAYMKLITVHIFYLAGFQLGLKTLKNSDSRSFSDKTWPKHS